MSLIIQDFCQEVGFRYSTFQSVLTQDNFFQYLICVNHVGDCERTISPGEVRTCTIENYIWNGDGLLPTVNAIDGNDNGAITTGTTTSQSNNAITTTTNTQSSNVGTAEL